MIVFAHFISALSETFPDYDFQQTKPAQFRDTDINTTLRLVNTYLAEAAEQVHLDHFTPFFEWVFWFANSNLSSLTLQVPGILERLWAAIDDTINLKQCEVFSYTRDESELDEEEDGPSIWEFHFFFFNKEMDLLCYLTCAARR